MKGFWRLAAASVAILIAAAPLPGHAVPIQTNVTTIINGTGFFFLSHTPASSGAQLNAIAETISLSVGAMASQPEISVTPIPASTAGFPEDGDAEMSVPEPSALMLLGLGLLALPLVRKLTA